ncbi:hypothetical protein F2P81_012237 [Scophthalmus maximus]|uniref:Uncharacterized protein n=1 Tax=Scophthalmus maximus TaxID=52904 RepID=A0A6A4SP49_SCOMX|nr:hypothetical protein F2P81_012237 [Scophthalmus maximus]
MKERKNSSTRHNKNDRDDGDKDTASAAAADAATLACDVLCSLTGKRLSNRAELVVPYRLIISEDECAASLERLLILQNHH